ncbi:MAG: 3-phosphoserine/phosphohydroxythreonine transaminase [Candidatus Omnitrophica bacterium]|nr:3-phosphoserine/phosphohydroxythreonine transaminase [Candidatus Omnitrophota bacterium]
MARAFNFSAGPAALPEEVILQIKADLPEYSNCGSSIMEVSHRGKVYGAVHEEAIANVRKLLKLPDDYAVLLLQGGATAQFAMIPMNFLGDGQTADYVNSGAWAKKAIQEAKAIGKVNVAADTEKSIPTRMPLASELKLTDGAAYLHITSNETIAGTQWQSYPKPSCPLVADMSSDILSRPMNAADFALIYAGAQKNLGPSGVTLVIIRKDWAAKSVRTLPGMFQYSTHIQENSLYNTPPCFSIYVLALVTRWLLGQGGVEAIAQRNKRKADLLYAAIDSSGFYKPTAAKECRSQMNVTFRLPSEELEEQFVKEAKARGLVELKGHRSVGGIRASIYNAMPEEGVKALTAFMKEFEKKKG